MTIKKMDKVLFQKTTLYFIKNNSETTPIPLQQLKNTFNCTFFRVSS